MLCLCLNTQTSLQPSAVRVYIGLMVPNVYTMHVQKFGVVSYTLLMQ